MENVAFCAKILFKIDDIYLNIKPIETNDIVQYFFMGLVVMI